jgi:hypothetical protein
MEFCLICLIRTFFFNWKNCSITRQFTVSRSNHVRRRQTDYEEAKVRSTGHLQGRVEQLPYERAGRGWIQVGR